MKLYDSKYAILYRVPGFVLFSIYSLCGQEALVKSSEKTAEGIILRKSNKLKRKSLESYMSTCYQDCPALHKSAPPLSIEKSDLLEFTSDLYCLETHHRPSRHPLNPFLAKGTDNEPVQFAYSYQEQYVQDSANFERQPITYNDLLYIQDPKERKTTDGQAKFNTIFCRNIFIDHYARKVYRVPKHTHESSKRLFIGPNKRGWIVFIDDNLGTLNIGKLHEDHVRGTLEISLINDDKDCKVDSTQSDPITAVALDEGEKSEATESLSSSARNENNTRCLTKKSGQHDVQKNVIITGTMSGKLFYHELSCKMNFIPGDHTTPCITSKELSITLVGPVKDIRLNKNASIAWVLDARSLYRYDLATHQHRLICTLPSHKKDFPSSENLAPDEIMICCTISPDENYILIGGSHGSVVLTDSNSGICYLIDCIQGCPILDLWWNAQNEIVIFSRSRKVRAFKIKFDSSNPT